jgi:hypothetical protein
MPRRALRAATAAQRGAGVSQPHRPGSMGRRCWSSWRCWPISSLNLLLKEPRCRRPLAGLGPLGGADSDFEVSLRVVIAREWPRREAFLCVGEDCASARSATGSSASRDGATRAAGPEKRGDAEHEADVAPVAVVVDFAPVRTVLATRAGRCGMSTVTGVGTRIGATWLPSRAEVVARRLDTGTPAAIGSTASPREPSRSCRAVTATRTASLTVAPTAFTTQKYKSGR